MHGSTPRSLKLWIARATVGHATPTGITFDCKHYHYLLLLQQYSSVFCRARHATTDDLGIPPHTIVGGSVGCLLTSTSDLISFSVMVWTASPTLLPGRLSVMAKIVAATVEPSKPSPSPPPPKGGLIPSVAFLGKCVFWCEY